MSINKWFWSLIILIFEIIIFGVAYWRANLEEEIPGNDLRANDIEILKGRIWPAIQSCVSNRYKILLSFFAFYSFIMKSTIISITDRHDIQLYTSILFFILTIINSYNYSENSHEQWEKEHNQHRNRSWKEWFRCNDVEIAFFVIMMDLVVGGYFLINLDC